MIHPILHVLFCSPWFPTAYNPSYVAPHLPCLGLRLALNFTKSRIRRRSNSSFLAANQRRRALLMNRQMGSRVDRSIARNRGILNDCNVEETRPPRVPMTKSWKWPECGSHGMKEWANIAKVVPSTMTREEHAWRRQEIQSRFNLHKCEQSCTNVHKSAQICTNVHKSAQSCTNVHKAAQSFTILHKPAQTCTNLLKCADTTHTTLFNYG